MFKVGEGLESIFSIVSFLYLLIMTDSGHLSVGTNAML